MRINKSLRQARLTRRNCQELAIDIDTFLQSRYNKLVEKCEYKREEEKHGAKENRDRKCWNCSPIHFRNTNWNRDISYQVSI